MLATVFHSRGGGRPAGGKIPGSGPAPDLPRALEHHPSGTNYEARLSAFDEQGREVASVTRARIEPAVVEGGIAVVCSAGPPDVSQTEASRVPTMSGFNMQHRARQGNWRFWFRNLQV